MKINKLLSFLIITFFFTTSAQAVEVTGLLGWGATTAENGTFIVYQNDYDPIEKILEVYISHSNAGEQRLYIKTSRDEGNDCEKYPKITSSTMIFNGQAVKMMKECRTYTDINETFSSYTPETDKGHNYVVNLFKTATTPIELIVNNDTLYVPVIGFTKVWNNAGGNAI